MYLYHLLKFDYFFEFLRRQLVFHDAAFIDVLPLLIIFICFIDKVDDVIVGIQAFDIHLKLWIAEVLFPDVVDGIGVDAEEGGVLCQNLVSYWLADDLVLQFFLIQGFYIVYTVFLVLAELVAVGKGLDFLRIHEVMQPFAIHILRIWIYYNFLWISVSKGIFVFDTSFKRLEQFSVEGDVEGGDIVL